MNILDIFIFSLNAILPLILIIVIGFVFKKIGIINDEFIKVGNKVVFKLCLPVLLFCNVVEIEGLNNINFTSIAYILVIIFLLALSGYLVSKTVEEKDQKGVMMQCVFRSNFALIGVPLAELIGGTNAIQSAAILSVFSIPIYNILAVIVLTVFVGSEASHSVSKQIKAIAKNPLIIGVLLGVVVMLVKYAMPSSVTSVFTNQLSFIPTTLKYISKAATPLALLVLGGQFEFTRVAGYKKQIVVATAARTILAPVLGIGIAGVLQKCGIIYFEPGIYAAFIALFGTPVAVSSAIMAENMNNDGQLAAQLVVWTSLISVFTLFIFIFLTRCFGLI